MCSNGFINLFNEPTRITELSVSCIDHVLVRDNTVDTFVT